MRALHPILKSRRSRGVLDFNAKEFMRMSHEQRIGIYRQLANRARTIAGLSHANSSSAYLRIADEWDKLAEDMEKQA